MYLLVHASLRTSFYVLGFSLGSARYGLQIGYDLLLFSLQTWFRPAPLVSQTQ